MDIKEIIDLLEAAASDEGDMIHYLEINLYSGEIPKETWNIRKLLIKLALTLLKQQPKAGEFTKKMREKYKYAIDNKLCVSAVVYEEALKRLDTAEAINKEKTIALANELEDCKPYAGAMQMRKALKIRNKDLLRYGHHDSPCAGILDLNEDSECTCGFEAAISKARGIENE